MIRHFEWDNPYHLNTEGWTATQWHNRLQYNNVPTIKLEILLHQILNYVEFSYSDTR